MDNKGINLDAQESQRIYPPEQADLVLEHAKDIEQIAKDLETVNFMDIVEGLRIRNWKEGTERSMQELLQETCTALLTQLRRMRDSLEEMPQNAARATFARVSDNGTIFYPSHPSSLEQHIIHGREYPGLQADTQQHLNNAITRLESIDYFDVDGVMSALERIPTFLKRLRDECTVVIESSGRYLKANPKYNVHPLKIPKGDVIPGEYLNEFVQWYGEIDLVAAPLEREYISPFREIVRTARTQARDLTMRNPVVATALKNLQEIYGDVCRESGLDPSSLGSTFVAQCIRDLSPDRVKRVFDPEGKPTDAILLKYQGNLPTPNPHALAKHLQEIVVPMAKQEQKETPHLRRPPQPKELGTADLTPSTSDAVSGPQIRTVSNLWGLLQKRRR